MAQPRGRLVVISAPSGAGKTSIISGILARRPEFVWSVSVTTRPPRPGERDGVDYRFVSDAGFDRLEAEGAFIESATVHDSRYATPRAPLDDALRAGKTMLLEIDVQGARSIRAARPGAVLIFVEPPNLEVLRQRLEARQTDPPEVIARRLESAADEMASAGEYDHRVVNDDLNEAVSRVIRILEQSATDAQSASDVPR